MPLPSDLSAWYAGRTIVVQLVVLSVYVYAFYISLAGRPIFGKSILPE